jgi:putative addiction module component (TIGR02574 family)
MKVTELDINAWTPDERLDLIERLWDSLSDEEVPVHPAVRAEVEKRLEAARSGAATGPIWDDSLKAKLLRREI